MPVSHSHQFLCVPLSRASRVTSFGAGRIGHVPDLVRRVAERAQQVDGAGIALRQRLAVAHAHHLRAAVLGQALLAGNVREVLRAARIGDVDDRGAVEFLGARQRIERLGHLLGAAVVADVGDPAAALLVDDRLIGAARLQVVGSRRAPCPSPLPATGPRRAAASTASSRQGAATQK